MGEEGTSTTQLRSFWHGLDLVTVCVTSFDPGLAEWVFDKVAASLEYLKQEPPQEATEKANRT